MFLTVSKYYEWIKFKNNFLIQNDTVGEGGRNTWHSSDSSDNEFEHYNDVEEEDDVEFVEEKSTKKVIDNIGNINKSFLFWFFFLIIINCT